MHHLSRLGLPPHDERVQRILRTAREYTSEHRLPGYEEWKNTQQQEKSTYAQARAIYEAIRKRGVSYVKSSLTFGNNGGWSERVRMPRETLAENSTNCIDSAVLFASLFENLGLEPMLVVVPGHAYAAVRLTPHSEDYLVIDSALTGRATFDAAVAAARNGLSRYSASEVRRISISQARLAGIYPMQ